MKWRIRESRRGQNELNMINRWSNFIWRFKNFIISNLSTLFSAFDLILISKSALKHKTTKENQTLTSYDIPGFFVLWLKMSKYPSYLLSVLTNFITSYIFGSWKLIFFDFCLTSNARGEQSAVKGCKEAAVLCAG